MTASKLAERNVPRPLPHSENLKALKLWFTGLKVLWDK